MTYKKIDPKEKIFHYIEISTSKIALYDSELDQPVAYGSKVLIANAIKNLSPKVTIYYYDIKRNFIKLGKTYMGS
jgi:hypothetical protein